MDGQCGCGKAAIREAMIRNTAILRKLDAVTVSLLGVVVISLPSQ